MAAAKSPTPDAGAGRRLSVRQALDQGMRLLGEAAVGAPRLTAEVLLCHALQRDKAFLYAHGGDEMSELAWIHYGRYLHQRLQGKPTQYITKTQEWYGRPFRVTPDVLIPRPETEHVIEVALARTPRRGRTVDIGCGSGAIGVTWQLETGCPVMLSDISTAALAVASGNADALAALVDLVAGDLGAAFGARAFDIVLSNPPYIPDPERETLQREVRDFEPAVALFGGPTGVEIYARLISDVERIIVPGGWLVMEIGYQGQARIEAMLGEAGRWRAVETAQDLAGWPRVVSAQYCP